jgi:hypothetical protein
LPPQFMNVTRHTFKKTIYDVSIYDWMNVNIQCLIKIEEKT